MKKVKNIDENKGKNSIKILLIRNDRIGDLLVSIPLIENLKQLYPSAEIDIVLSPKNIFAKSLIANFINEIYIYRKNILSILKLMFILKRRKYDYAIDLHYNFSRTSNKIIKFIKAKQSIGFTHNELCYDINIAKPLTNTMPMADIMNQLLSALEDLNEVNLNNKLSIEIKQEKKEFIGSDFDSTKTNIGINISGSSLARTYSSANLIELIKQIKSIYTNSEIYIYSTKQTESIAKEIANQIEVRVLIEFGTIEQLAASISNLNLYITPDTATIHLAAAFQIPTIVLYSFVENHPTELTFIPVNPKYFPIFPKENSINSITVPQIIATIQSVLN